MDKPAAAAAALRRDFDTISNTRLGVESIFVLMERNLGVLKTMYNETIQSNRNDVFMFGLDSFHFQSKLLDVEFDDLKRQFLLINNRMYCEYYKLYRLVVDYVKKNVPDKRLHNSIRSTNLPVYKDLEPYRVYAFDVVKDTHASIMGLLHGMGEYISVREQELATHRQKQNIGLNINNFVLTFDYNIRLVKEKLRLFEAYLAFFHDLHSKRLSHFNDKMNLLYRRMITDVHFDETGVPVEVQKFDVEDQSILGDDMATATPNPSPSPNETKRNMRHIFQKNVTKLMRGLRFLGKKKTDLTEPPSTMEPPLYAVESVIECYVVEQPSTESVNETEETIENLPIETNILLEPEPNLDSEPVFGYELYGGIGDNT